VCPKAEKSAEKLEKIELSAIKLPALEQKPSLAFRDVMKLPRFSAPC
jgi:hypothetical protein